MSTTSEPTPLSTYPEPAAAPGPRGTERAGSSGRDVWPLVRRLHFYAGVFIAPFLVLAALTGLAYAFTPQLDGLVYGDKLRVERASGAPRPLADQVRAARAAHPEGTIATVIPPADKHAATGVVLSVPELDDRQRTVYVDPYTGRVKGALTTSFGSTPLTTWLSELHSSLHLGEPGRLYSELAASWLWVVAGGGLLLWMGRRRQYRGRAPARRVLWVDRSARGVRRTRSRHAVTGMWLATVLLFLSATGLTWSEHAGARFDTVQAELRSTAPELNTARPGTPARPSGGHGGHGGGDGAVGDPAADVDRVLATARAAGLSGPVEISPPEDAHSVWKVAQVDDRWPVHRDQAAIDAATGRVTARVAWADHPWPARLSTLGVQFHMGRLFGPANQVLLAATALGLLGMIFWGYRMWWQRRPTRADRRARFGRPPARGTWRQSPRTVLLFGVPAVVVVGWAIPLFGITLLTFLAIDAAVGAVRRRRSVAPATR